MDVILFDKGGCNGPLKVTIVPPMGNQWVPKNAQPA